MSSLLHTVKSWNETPTRTIFPRCIDPLVKVGGLIAALGGGYVTLLVAFGTSPKTLAVGYAPEQPIPYSHAVHVGQLGLDCRYCHTSLETGAKANIPPTGTCWNCHSMVLTESPKLEPLRESHATGNPIRWVRVHDVADYAYFDHSAHVRRGIGCVSCHGRVDTMEVVRQVEPLSMAWCVDCHRHPELNLRPPEQVTNMTWEPTVADMVGATEEERAEFLAQDDERDKHAAFGAWFKEHNKIDPPTDCSTCHR